MVWGRVAVLQVQVEVTDDLWHHSDAAVHVLIEQEKGENFQSAIYAVNYNPNPQTVGQTDKRLK